MLVVISDLHFVDGTSGDHNLPTSAFKSVFLSDIVALAEEKGATEIKLLLLGDIPDLIRSQRWFEEDPVDRPWGESGLRDIPVPRPGSRTEQRCLEILGRFPADGRKESVPQDTILHRNWETFAFFRNFKTIVCERLGRNLPAQLILVVGNHDRLCNVYPSVRNELRKIMGLTVNAETALTDADGEWWYRYDFRDDRYGLFARHGHQFDPWNYAGGNGFTRHDHLQVPVGDIVATEFAVNLPRTLASLREKYPAVTDELIDNLKEIDNVRPVSRIIEWFHHKIKQEHSEQVREALDETFDTVVNHFLAIDHVRRWHTSETRWDEIMRLATRPWMRYLIGAVTDITSTQTLVRLFLPHIERAAYADVFEDSFSKAAFRERIWQENERTHYIVYGHTHRPKLQPLDRVGEREVLYLNTGTWRGHMYRTLPLDGTADFMKLRQLTYATFYNAEEDLDRKEPDSVSFDIWTGHKHKLYAD